MLQFINWLKAWAGTDADVLFMGDFNFGDGEKEESVLPEHGFADLWKKLHPDEKGLTWNIEASEMARKGSFAGEASRRLDRIYLKGPAWQARSIRIIGEKPITPGEKTLFPSDHFGLHAVLVRTDPATSPRTSPARIAR